VTKLQRITSASCWHEALAVAIHGALPCGCNIPSGRCVPAESKSVDDGLSLSDLAMQGRAVVPKRQVALKATVRRQSAS